MENRESQPQTHINREPARHLDLMFYEDDRRYTGPRLWRLRAEHTVLDHIDRVFHRCARNLHLGFRLGRHLGDGWHWSFCDHVEGLFIRRLVHDRAYEQHLVDVGRLTHCVTTTRKP